MTAEKDPTLPADVIRAIEQGRRTKAIKLLREIQGLSLKQAKERIDAYVRVHHVNAPIRHIESTGILPMLLFLLCAWLIFRFLFG
ncbi:MAG TPA: hypothetical protein VIK69_00325 [Methylophilaceae bacterium]|jgi:hypothetical protein